MNASSQKAQERANTVRPYIFRPARLIRNAYYRRFPALRYAVTRKKRVLLYVNNAAMTSHIKRYCEPLLSDGSYAFYLYYPEMPAGFEASGDEFARFVRQSDIKISRRPAWRAWDLIVCADLRTPASFTRDMTPLLYVNHGLHIISDDGGDTLYCYGKYAFDEKGRPRFTKMCEPNGMICERMRNERPELSDVIVHTGFKFAGDIERAVKNREAYRRGLGVDESATLVGLFGTWRENSLFHALGEGIFDACHELRDSGYQFLFSIHPKEYERYDEKLTPMGPMVEKQRKRGMLVRSPGEDFLPYMAACDIVISDYSSMAESAMLFGRRLIFSPYPDGMVWRHSLTAKAREALPCLKSPENLRRVLDEARSSPLHPFIESAGSVLTRKDHDEIIKRLTREMCRLKSGEASDGTR